MKRVRSVSLALVSYISIESAQFANRFVGEVIYQFLDCGAMLDLAWTSTSLEHW